MSLTGQPYTDRTGLKGQAYSTHRPQPGQDQCTGRTRIGRWTQAAGSCYQTKAKLIHSILKPYENNFLSGHGIWRRVYLLPVMLLLLASRVDGGCLRVVEQPAGENERNTLRMELSDEDCTLFKVKLLSPHRARLGGLPPMKELKVYEVGSEPTGLPPPVGVLVEVSGEKTTLYSIDSDSDLALAMTTFAQSGTEIITDSQMGNAQFTTATGPISTATHPTTTCICTTSTTTTESGTSASSSTILGTTTPNGDCDCSGIATTTNSPQTTTTIPTTQPTRCTCTTTNPTTTTMSGVSSTTVLTSTTTTGWTTSDGGCDCGDGMTTMDITTSDIEEETSTALPIGTGSGRRLRRELLELERQQAGTKFETKLMKNIPFIQFN